MRHRRASRLVALVGIAVAMTATAAGSPAPSPSPPQALHGGTENAKAALVRIELRAVAEIAHIDHSTGEVEISRGRSTVPLGFATGVLVSADGIVATTWENLAVDDGAVAVYAANELFTHVLGAPVVGNDGNPARRGTTPDHHWGPHLQHCYDQVTHCVIFRAPQYDVLTYTSEPGGVMAELLNAPSKPNDVALLRISGGGAAPTASLDAPGAGAGDAAIFGFTEQPAINAGPAELPVAVDAATGRISPQEAVSAPLDAGVSGGPVLDRTTGSMLGLAGTPQPDGTVTLVPTADIRAAMEAAGVKPSPSKFDAVFRRGIDHLASGNPGGSAENELEESLTYYDSALASSRLDQARAMRSGQATENSARADSKVESPFPLVLPLVLTSGVLLAGVGAIAYRRRAAAAPAQGAAPSKGAGRHSVAPAVPASGISAEPTVAAKGRTKPPADPNPERNAGLPPRADGEQTQLAEPVVLRAAAVKATSFCPQCGQTVRPGARFCVGCGRPVG
ncbi:zinc ribbon domain-containing protein [Arthrobacter sp. PsM3]|uniref:zinc ribbon domain-containing protein n=1 Tax=Arthrobacter sp. PsM3 TaxID=3030531 RepID=UPI00263B1602|nr:zinc ribbon domain-containing protein [Arthrobacter sp. PsM3]